MGWEEDENTESHQSWFSNISSEAVTYHCLNLAICAENGSQQGLNAGYSLPPSILERMSRSG